MTTTITPSSDDVYRALRAYVQSIVGTSIEVVKGLANRVPMPDGPFVAITALFRDRLATNVDTYDTTNPAPTVVTSQASYRFDIQIDCFGPTSGDWSQMISQLFRDSFAVNALQPNCAPLYADDPRQVALTDGEQQYEERWSVTACLQYSPVVSIPQDFADTAQVGFFEVDATFHP